MTLLVDPPPPRDRGGQRQSTQRSATDQLDAQSNGAQLAVDDTQLEDSRAAIAPSADPAARADTAEPDVAAPAVAQTDADTDTAQPDTDTDTAQPDTDTETPRLAEPPIPGGRVEAAMGVVIRVLSHSPLARPLPAVILSALGIGGVAFVGLCATAPVASAATPPVLLPLTSVARDLGAPHLPNVIADSVMYVSIGLCCLGLAM